MENGMLLALSEADKERIHETVLRILDEVGILVENRDMLEKLKGFGAEVDSDSEIARFPKALIQEYLDSREEPPAEERNIPSVSAGAGIFVGRYLDPDTNEHVDWTEERLAAYVKTALALPNIDGVSMLCCPLKDVAPEIHPLHSKYLNWKLGMSHINYALHETAILPYLEEFHSIREEFLGIPLKKGMRGGVFMVSPLKVPRIEADQYVWCAQKGYHCFMTSMISSGGSGPVTVPGSVAVHLAENVFSNILQTVYYNRNSLYMGCSISPLDMKRGGFCYARPEKTIANLIFGQMCQFYGVPAAGQCGAADAKVPGSEAGAQKLITALPQLSMFSTCAISPGMLSVDEICSPIQMVLDNELIGALKRLIQPEPINEDTLAFDTIVEAGHGGVFTDKMHTALHFKETVWDPEFWTADLYDGWAAKGKKTIEELALDKWHTIMEGPDQESTMTPEADEKVKNLMDRALGALRI
ncbi:trimethylamine methyltransferase family protein [Planctomycetota bacterium]